MPAAAPAPLPPQLDLFEHSRSTMLHNDVLDALLQRDVAAATAALQALAQQEPQHHALAALGRMLQALGQAPRHTAPLPDHAALAAARLELGTQVQPAALAVLGHAAGHDWLAPLWRQLAARAEALGFDAAQADDHAAALWLQAGGLADAAQAERAVQAIPSWQHIPVPLGWMLLARWRQTGLDAQWPLLVALCWLAPARAAACITGSGDPLLRRLWRRFEDQFDPDPADGPTGTSDALTNQAAWFPAWLMTEQPALLPRLRQAAPGQQHQPEQAFRLLAGLLGLERQGRQADLVAERARLRALAPALFQAYMRTR